MRIVVGCIIAIASAAPMVEPAASQVVATPPMQQIESTGTQLLLLRDARLGPNRVAVLTRDLLYCYPLTGDLILVPNGYVTDFASVPPGASRVVDRYGDNIEAAVVHDWLYAVGEPNRRGYADELFRFALAEQGVGLAERTAAYLAVRAGGANAYGRSSEWDRRFYDVEAQRPMPSPYARRASAIIARLSDCDALETSTGVDDLKDLHGSHTWPRP